jgi:cyclase
MNVKLLRSITILLALLTGLVSINASAKRWQPWTVELERIELAPNVYAVIDTLNKEWLEEMGGSGATSAGFIVGEKGVLVVETLVNPHLTAQLLALIREVTDKPILYAVNTSYHGDHMYGNYLFPNTTIIQHEESKKYFEEKLEGDLIFMQNVIGHPEGLDNMADTVVDTGDILINDDIKNLRVDLGDRIVEIRQFGFGQTRGDLQVWVPDAKVFWVGNAILGPKPVLPWLTEGGHKLSLETLLRIKEFLPSDAIVVSGHQIPFTVSDKNNGLDFHIDYLRTMDTKVKQAVDQGLGLMDTVEHAAMDEFQGYDMFNWTHKQMNLPCAYRHHMLQKSVEIPEDEMPLLRHCLN